MNTIKLLIDRIYLQFFNDPPTDPPNDPPADTPSDPPADPPSDKQVTMSQKDLDDLIAKRVARAAKSAEKKYQESDEYKEYQKYLDGKKTEDEKIKEQLTKMGDLESSNQTLQSQLDQYKNKELMNGKIADEFKEFVLFKVQSNVSDDKTFEDALNEFIKDEANAGYLPGDPRSTRQQRRQKKDGAGQTEVESIMGNLYPGRKK